jgi:hypothetical protein
MSRVLTGDKLVESVRNRAMIPNDTSVYTDDNILDIANEELDVQLLDKLLSLHEEHLTVHVDIPRNSEGVYDIPYRAIGNKIRDVAMIEGNAQYEMAQISIGELPDYTYESDTYSYGMDKFYVESNQIKVLQPSRSYSTIRIYFYIRPSYLTKLEQCAVITSIIEDTTEVTFMFSEMPSKFSSLSSFDIVGARTPNKIKAWDKSSAEVNSSLKYIKFNKSDIESELGDIKVGDYVCKAEESPVPNIPTEMHPVLAQLTAVHILEALGDTEGLGNAQRRLDRMITSTMQLVDDRVELAPKKIKPRHGTLSEARASYNRRRRRGR